MKHVLAFLLAFACLSTSAATVADRSPFAQGLWWDPAKPGSGFEVMNASGTVFLVWYTYDTAGNPTWYTAQGSQALLGTQDWAILKHRWTGGKHQDPGTVGKLRVTVNHAESISLAWTLDGASGATTIAPYILSGTNNEVDHTGIWFDPANPGWGMSITEQGPFNGAALFTYDAKGDPTWASGFERGTGGVTLYRASGGACPGCTYRLPLMASVGRVTFDFAQESFLTLRDGTVLAMPDGINAQGARMTQLGRPASLRLADRALAAYDDASLLAYLRSGVVNVPYASGCVDFSASPAPTATSPTFSQTNLQEAGVDEAGLVKSDGTYLYAFGATLTTQGGYSSVSRNASVRVARVDQDGAKFSVVGSTPIGRGSAAPMDTEGLYLRGQQLVALHGTAPFTCGIPAWSSGSQWQGGRTYVEVFDATNPAALASRWQLTVDGHLVASRRIDATLYLVVRHAAAIPGVVPFAAAGSAAAAANATILAATPLSKFLPTWTDGTTTATLASGAVFAPPAAGTAATADLVTVLAIDLDALRVVDAMAIAGPTETAYASPTNLVVATSRATYRTTTGALLSQEPYFARTDLHEIALADRRLSVAGTGTVEGILDANPDRSAFRLSDASGQLRIVSSSQGTGLWGSNRNRLTVLEPSAIVPGMLKTVAWLPNDARPEPLGKPNEVLYGTRFAGDRLYAVSFYMIDPLYVVDLSSRTDPRIAGSLAVPGYADYLHPLPGGFLLGFGKDAIPTGTGGDGQGAYYQGLQASLYDVRNPASPALLSSVTTGKRGSNSALARDHQALSTLALGSDSLAFAVPAQVNDGAVSYGTGPATTYAWQYDGLLRYRVDGLAGTTPRLVPLAPLVIATANIPGSSISSAADEAASFGRSVLFNAGSVYVGGGRFWHQDAATGATTGPF